MCENDAKPFRLRFRKAPRFLRLSLLTCFAGGLSLFWSPALAADAYFKAALSSIEQDLLTPPSSYGLKVTDTVTSSLNSKPMVSKASYSFFVADGKVRYDYARYHSENIDKPPYKEGFMVSVNNGQETKVAELSRDGANMLRIGDSKSKFSIGQDEVYEYNMEGSDSEFRPDRQPYQILKNPAFAHLEITPVEIESLTVTQASDEMRMKVYELRKDEGPTHVYTLKLFFAPDHSNMLAKSEEGFAKVRADGQLEFLRRYIRTVDKWQVLPGGEVVPARFSLRRERNGVEDFSLIREISDASIGSVDEALFDTANIPAFKAKFDRIVDAEFERKQHAERMAGRIPSLPNPLTDSSAMSWTRNLFLVANVILIIALLIVLIWRRWPRTAS